MENQGYRTVARVGAVSVFLFAALAAVYAEGFAGSKPQAEGAKAAGGAEISGRVNFKGDRPKLQSIDMSSDPVCESEQEEMYAEDGDVNTNGTLPNAFVYIKSGSTNLSAAPPRNSVVLTQEGCRYSPHVLGVMAGQPLQVVTPDPTTHNIHVTPKINKEWNVTQEPGSPSIVKTFTQPEVMIPVRCNIHPWMKAYIGVMANPYFAVTDNQGNFTIKGVPPGEYTLEAWTATFGTQDQKVVVRPGEPVSVSFLFSPH